MNLADAAGVLSGYAADLVFGDPVRLHPVAGFGRLALAGERRRYRDSRMAGLGHAVELVTGAVGTAAVADRAVRRRSTLRTALVGTALWAALGARSLHREAAAVAAAVDADELDRARLRVRSLVSRDPEGLDDKGLLRAAVESVAENTSDAIVAPLLWTGVAGVPGVVAHRAANTLDAMVGYRNERYERFGWAAARLDDLLNLGPARLTVVLAALLAPVVGGDADRTRAVVLRDGRVHASPNAGPVEAAFAGALDVRLGDDVVTYQGRTIRRPPVGDGPTPAVEDVRRAVLLSRAVGLAAALIAAAAAGVRR